MLRDFSQDERAKLLEEIDNVEADHREWVLLAEDAIEDQRALDKLLGYIEGLAAYHQNILDAKGCSRDQVEKVWKDAGQADADHAAAMAGRKAEMADVAARLRALGQAMSPTGPDGHGLLLLRPLDDIRAHFDSSMGPIDYGRENDKWMQRRCDELLRDEFSADVWDEIGQPGERFATKEEFLQALFDKVQKIMGTSANGVVDFSFSNPDHRGEYDHNTGTVSINGTQLHADENNNTIFGIPKGPNDTVSTYGFTRTIFHELRHAYQHETMDDPSSHPFVNPETIAAWQGNRGANYIQYNRNNPGPYFDQPLEFDARSFAGQYTLGQEYLPPTDWLHWQQDYIDEGVWPP